MLYRWSVALLCFVSIGSFVACETPDDDAIAQSQQCLDGATTKSAATGCLAKISGIDTPRSNRVRCGIHFLQGGIDKERFKLAYQASKSTSSGSSPSAAMMQHLLLSTTENSSVASDLQTACRKSGLAGLARLGDMIFTATSIGSVCNSADPATCAGQFNGNLAGFDPNSAAGQAVGQTIIDMANTSCNSTQGTPPDYCAQVNSAVQGGATPAQVAACLKIKLQNPDGVCP